MPRSEFTPQIRAALLAAAASPTHRLRRCKGGFVAPPSANVRTGGTAQVTVVTRRTVLRLQRDGLLQFDDGTEFATSVILTREGIEAAEQLAAQAGAA
ncbi:MULTISPECIES: hypothetical protein [Luteimonas]|uniref:hypothetical protein n=1 Tax=Luteimonas TaxID=83614 RepID=UPI000C7A7333|nr:MULTISPECIES: hypothetical protein [Luteimonas]